MSDIVSTAARPPSGALRRILSLGLAFMLSIASLVGLSQSASAATPGISANLLLNGQSYNGTPIVNEGDVLTLRVQYTNAVTPGASVVFTVGDNVDLTGVPEANTAIESIDQVGNQVTITFKDPWPAGVNQGVFDLKLTVSSVAASELGSIDWAIDGEESS